MVQNEEFYQIADLLEHDLVKLKHGINQMSIREVHTLSETRELISRASDIDRRLRGKTFFEGLEYRSRLGQGIHDRCEAFLLRILMWTMNMIKYGANIIFLYD